MEETTTTTDPEVQGAVTAEPTEPVGAAATQPAEPDATAEPSIDENLEWLTNKGIDPQSPEALAKVAEMYRNAEKAMHQSTTKASELERSLTEAPSHTDGAPNDLVAGLVQEVQGLKIAQDVNTFFGANPDAKALEPAMQDIVTTRPEIGELVKNGYLSLSDLYNLARGGDPNRDKALKTEGGKEALESVAGKQRAKAVTGQATTSGFGETVTKANFDSWYTGLSSSERARPENQAIVNSMLS